MGSIERRCKCPRDTPKNRCTCPTRDVRWRARPWVGGQRGPAETFATERDAKRHNAETETAPAHTDLRVARGVLFRDWVPEWQATRGVLKTSTQATDRARLPHLLDEFGSLPLAGIGPTLVRQWVARLCQTMAPKTVRHLHAMLHGILQLAVVEGLLPKGNPCVGTKLPESAPQEHAFLTREEARALIEAHPAHWRPLVITLIGTGMRWAEAVGLRVGRVDMAQSRLTVGETWSPRFGWTTPKSKAGYRPVLVAPEVMAAIEPLLVGKGQDDPVFLTPQGRMVHHANYRDRVWMPALIRAGLTGRALSPHKLRHSYVAWMIAEGIPLTAISRQIGHKSIQVTSDVYGGVMPEVDMRLLTFKLVLAGEVPDTVPDGWDD